MIKSLIGFALAVADVILAKAMVNASKAHQMHGAPLAAYAFGALLSIALWYWVLHRKPARPAAPAARPSVPYGGPR